MFIFPELHRRCYTRHRRYTLGGRVTYARNAARPIFMAVPQFSADLAAHTSRGARNPQASRVLHLSFPRARQGGREEGRGGGGGEGNHAAEWIGINGG